MNGATVRPDGEGFTASAMNSLTFRPVYALTRMQAQSMRIAMSYQLEGLSFLGRRLGKDLKLLDDLSTSRGTGEALEAYAEFCQDALQDYAGEMAKLTSIGAAITPEVPALAASRAAQTDDQPRTRHDA